MLPKFRYHQIWLRLFCTRPPNDDGTRKNIGTIIRFCRTFSSPSSLGSFMFLCSQKVHSTTSNSESKPNRDWREKQRRWCFPWLRDRGMKQYFTQTTHKPICAIPFLPAHAISTVAQSPTESVVCEKYRRMPSSGLFSFIRSFPSLVRKCAPSTPIFRSQQVWYILHRISCNTKQ